MTARRGTTDAPQHVDVIVVGSGFGGAVAAARLAQAGHSVTVLERGRRWLPGGFPRSSDLHDGWLWQDDHGLYDARWLDSMLTVQGAGWGGGSLVYANVFARPAAETQDDRWPAALRRETLDPYYDLAGTMLGVSPVGPDPVTGQLPARTHVLEEITGAMGIRPATFRPNLAVRFGDPESWGQNLHGMPQRGCAFVGQCILGCNRSAKNSLDLNYLAVALQHGATAVTGAEVRRIAPDRSGWAVWSAEGDGDDEGVLVRRTAARVVLAAGAVATTELLLRSRDVDGTLPDLSPTLGHGFSGNGDHLALGTLHRETEDLTTGPTITTSTVLDVQEHDQPVWFQVQDGAVPRIAMDMLDQLLPLPGLRTWWRKVRRRHPRNTLALLSMGHDTGSGRLALDQHGRARLEWDNRREAHLYRAEGRVGPAMRRVLGSRVHAVLPWSVLRRPVTVHPLGGVPAGPDRWTGVVGDDVQVHGYPGLYVMDGSVIPASTGANPSATILAGAEQAVERLIRTMSGDRTWRAPEWEHVRPLPVPEDEAYRWMAHRRRETVGDGVVLDETMHELTQHDDGAGQMRVRLEIPGLDTFRSDPGHSLRVSGTIRLAAVPGTHEVDGELQLFPDHGKYLMRYDLNFTDRQGRDWTAVGIKRQLSSGPIARYRSLTTARVTLRRVGDPRVQHTATLVLHPHDVMAGGLSIRGVGFTRTRRAKASLDFSKFFLTRALGRRARP